MLAGITDYRGPTVCPPPHKKRAYLRFFGKEHKRAYLRFFGAKTGLFQQKLDFFSKKPDTYRTFGLK
jgi:hypothetical protein